MDDDMRDLLEIFREESQEGLGRVARNVEALQDAPDKTPLLEEIDRELHKLKGSARMLGYAALGRLIHETESLARAMRQSSAPGMRELLVEAADRLTVLVLSCAQKGADEGDQTLEEKVRKAALAGRSGATPPGGSSLRQPTRSATIEASDPDKTLPSTADSWKVGRPRGSISPTGTERFGQAPGPAAAPQGSARFVRNEAAPPGTARLPQGSELTGSTRMKGAADPDMPTAAWQGQAPASAQVGTAPSGQPRPAGAEADKGTTSRIRKDLAQKEKTTGHLAKPEGHDEADLVRVRASKLAQLDGFVSELSLAKLRLDALEESLRGLASDLEASPETLADAPTAVRRHARRLREDRAHVARLSKGLERLAIEVRLRPVKLVVDPLPREAREIARRLGKKVRVRITGSETELDRTILDGVRDPLLHILRNAIDHGIEMPAERISKGKPEDGQVDVEAAQDGGSVVIRVTDDGRGIDPEKVRAAAVKKKVLSAEAAAKLSQEEAVDLVFRPGFSTKDTVSEMSGRGVGMDIVKSNVETLKGEVRLRSAVGKGTEITLRLPLTALVSRVLFFRAGKTLVGLPTSAVDATAIVGAADLGSFDGRPTVKHRGRSVPVARITDLLGLQDVEPDDEGDGAAQRLAIVRHNEDVLAVSVTSFEGERSVVVKPLGWPLERVRGTAGAVLLGTGDTALLLHVPDLLSFSHDAALAPRMPSLRARVMPDPERKRRVLIVDDSVVTRQLEKRILEGLGFDVTLAVDGVDAVRLLEREVPELIISDLEMPRLDGFGLIRRLRADARWSEVPIIIVSTRGADEDRRAGLEAGADAYVVKSEFDEAALSSTIERLLE